MNSFDFNDKIRFLLPDDYTFEQSAPDVDGNMLTAIRADEKRDDEGNPYYGFDCRVKLFVHDPSSFGKGFTSDRLLRTTMENLEKAKYCVLSTKPAADLIHKKVSLSLFGIQMNADSYLCVIQVAAWRVLSLTVTKRAQGDPDVLVNALTRLMEIADAVRLNGKRVPFSQIDVPTVVEALDYEDDDIDGIEDATSAVFAATADSGSRNKGYKNANPDITLYPHYKQLKNSSGPVAPGVFMITNATGTEYEFIPLSKAVQNNSLPYDERAVYQRAIDKDTTSYDLADRASEIQRLFHVNASVFSEKRDRECEIDQGLLHRAYMMSALRSFAWTLADYCETNLTDPDSVPVSTLEEIVSFCARKEWLNYKGNSHCDGLCGCSDLHVFYIPDAMSQSDREKLLPSKAIIQQTEQRKAIFPSYNPILDEVHSLDSLREDLAYIFPAIRALSNKLAETRNYNEALTGNEADIVYAWCSLAKAAKEPFYVEDGPSNCYFSQMQSSPYLYGAGRASDGFKGRATTSSNTSRVSPVSKSLPLDFPKGTIVYPGDDLEVFCGVVRAYNGSERDVILPLGITEIGEDVFQFSSLRSIVIPEGVTEIGNDAFYSCQELTHVSLPRSLARIGKHAFYECSKLKKIVFPEGLTEIEEYAFKESGLEEVRIPSSCTVIAEWTFNNCPDLSRVVLHNKVNEIKEFAFESCPKLTGIYVPKKTAVDEYAFDDDILIERVTSTKNKPVTNNIYEEIPKPSELTGFSVSPTGILTKYTGKNKATVELPKGIKRIGASVFESNYDIESVSIPEGVTRIDKEAFAYCGQLKSISFPTTLQTIGEDAFRCTSLSAVSFPESLQLIGDYAFSNCKSLKEVTFRGNECSTIGGSAFSGCVALKTLVLPEGLVNIGSSAFSRSGCVSVSLPASIKELGYFIFGGCEKLKEVTFHGKVDSIGSRVFGGCKALELLVIPEGTQRISGSAFAESKQLKDIFIPSSVGLIWLDDNDADKNTVFHVSPGSNAEKWCIDQQRKYDYLSYEEVLATRKMEQIYTDAMTRMKKGEYTAAKKKFASIPEYRDSAKQAQLCGEKASEQKLERIYNTAKELMEQGDYIAAKEKFLTIIGYKDAEQLVPVCEDKYLEQQKAKEYAKAKDLMNRGDFVGAKEAFLAITEYKDSEELVLICEGKHREQQKEIEYQRLVKLEYSAKTPEDWEKLAEEFENLEYNRAASLHADRCRRKAEEVRRQLEEQRIAEQRARERAERRQQLLDERRQLELTLERYKGLGSMFGEKAKIRKATLTRLKEIEDELSKLD